MARTGQGNAMGGAVVDSGKFNFMGNDKFPSLSKPEPAYHGLTFAETFGDLAFTIYGHAVGLRDLGPTMVSFRGLSAKCLWLNSPFLSSPAVVSEANQLNALDRIALLFLHSS